MTAYDFFGVQNIQGFAFMEEAPKGAARHFLCTDNP